ncbi:MAG: signal recognition particle receptor subunit alpha, partial [Actinomycetota bacterium]
MDPILIIVLAVIAVLVVAVAGYAITRSRGDEELQAGAEADRLDGAGGVGTLERPTDTLDAPPAADAAEVIDEAPVEAPAAPADEVLVKPSFFERLGKARSAFTGYLGGLVGLSKVDEEAWEELEEALVRADVGITTAMGLIEDVRDRAKEAGAEDGETVLGLLKARMHEELAGKDRSLRLDDGETNVWLVVGVNGVGKTTTIGKLGKRLADEGHKPLMAAGDTFRAAAAEQLTTWAGRSGAEIVRGNEGGDPSSVIFDGVQAAAARDCDVVLADTAGRLHNKSNLMDELAKVRRVAAKEPGHVSEVLLVIEAGEL